MIDTGYSLSGDSLEESETYEGTDNTVSSSLGSYTTSGDATFSTDAMGDTTQEAYTSSNLVWCEVAPSQHAEGTACPDTEPTFPATSTDLGMTLTWYNSDDQVTGTRDPLGHVTLNGYTSGVSEVPNGLKYCTIEPAEYAAGVTSCPSYGSTEVGVTTETFDSAGNVLTSTDADGDTTTSCYFWENGSDGAPSCAEGASGTNEPEGLYSTTAPDGSVTTYMYDDSDEVTKSVTTFNGYAATTIHGWTDGLEYCTIGPLAYSQGDTSCPSVPSSAPTPGSDPWPGDTITIFDADGRPLDVVNPLGGVTQYRYDGVGNKICSVSPSEYGQGVSCYNPDWPAIPSGPESLTSLLLGTSIDDSFPGATIYQYDENNRLIAETNPLGGVSVTIFDQAGNPSITAQNLAACLEVGPGSCKVAFSQYDADNRVVATETSANLSTYQTTQQYYDPNGNVFCSVSSDNFDAYACPVWEENWASSPPSPSSLYSSTPDIDQAAYVTTNFYDADGELVQTTDPDVDTTLYAYDAGGSQYCTVDATNVADDVTCPAYGASHVAGTTTETFDPMGQVLTSTDQVGDVTTNCYFFENASGQCAHGTPSSAAPDAKYTTSNPDGDTTMYCYYAENASGQCAYGAPSGGGTGGQLYSTTAPATPADPSGEVTTEGYEPGGAAATVTTPAGTTTDSYDAMGDVASVTESDTAPGYLQTPDAFYTYNQDGSRATMADASGTTTYSYDAMGNVTSQQLEGLTDATVGYTYSPIGQVLSTSYPAYGSESDPTVDYSYDGNGNVASETDWLGNTVNFGYDADGNLNAQENNVSTGVPDGTSATQFSYDQADELSGASSTLAQTCGSDETLTQSFDNSDAPLNPDGQLTEATSSYDGSCSSQPDTEVDYSYDQAGRLVYEGTSPQGVAANNFAYDAAGNPTTMSGHDASGTFDTYTQAFTSGGSDTGGQIVSQTPVSGSGGATSDFTYDSLGDQTQVTSGSTTTAASFDQTGQMVSATTPSGTNAYVYNGDGLEADALLSTVEWGSPTSIDGSNGLKGVSCPTTWFCMAVDNDGNMLTYNGSSWASPQSIDSGHILEAVSCPSTTFCEAVDHNGNAVSLTYDSGTETWSSSVTDADGSRALDGISCPSTTMCVAVDASSHDALYSSGTWTASGSSIDSHGGLEDVSCASTTVCMAVDTAGYYVVYNGSSWSSPTSTSDSHELFAVSCATTTACMVGDNHGNALSLTYNSGSWSVSSSNDVDGTRPLEAVSCASSADCQAVDNDGNVVSLTYGSGTWSHSLIDIDGTRSMTAISCPTTTFCAALDGYAVVLALASQSWNSVTGVDSHSITGISCPSTSFCGAIDSAGGFVSFDPVTAASSSVSAGDSHTLEAISCPSTTLCVIVDNDGEAVNLTYSSGSWSASSPATIDSTRALKAISCPSGTSCMAAGNGGYVAAWSPTSPSTYADDNVSSHTLDGVSCPSTGLCVAVDTAGAAISLTGGGTTWSASSITADSGNALEAVSCPTTLFCETVDNNGNAVSLTYASGSWSSSTPANIDGTFTLESISCASTTMCQAVDGHGNTVQLSGNSWSEVQNIDGSMALNAVSCATAAMCTAADNAGTAWVYSVAVATPLIWGNNGSEALILSDGTNDYIYGPGDTPVEEINLSTSTPTYMTYTPSDSSWLTTNEDGDETGFWSYDAYGTLDQGTPTSPFGFAGQYTDANTGLVNMRARWYDAGDGEFTTVDPDLAETDQPYEYAGDDPVNESDPSGKFTLGICLQAGVTFGLGSLLHGEINSGSACLTRTVGGATDQIGLTETLANVGSGTALGADLSGSIAVQISNANTLDELSGVFTNTTVSAGPIDGVQFGPGGTATFFTGSATDGRKIWGASLGISFGIGVDVAKYPTTTWVQVAHNPFLVIPADILWDNLAGPYNNFSLIGDALYDAIKYLSSSSTGC